MLWSLAKALIFFALVAAMTWGAAILSAAGGGIRIAMLGYEVTLGPLTAVVALVVLFVLLWLMLRLAGLVLALLRFLAGDETAVSRHFSRNRERRGHRALAEAMQALAAGEPHRALTRARRAERLLANPQLTTVLLAQAATAAGDQPRAEAAWRTLLADDASRFVGIRGLLQARLAAGDTDRALKLAEAAFALRPKHAETQETLLKLQTGAADWQGARQTLVAQMRGGSLPRDVWKRRDAVLAVQRAQEQLAAGETEAAHAAAIAANKASPDLVPAAALAARAQIAAGKPRAAARVLRKAWGVQPHPDLAAAWAAIVPDESPADRVRRFRALTDIAPDHPETRLLIAELQIAAEDFPAARRSLGDLATRQPTVRALAVMAAIERGSGADDAAVRGWLARALDAPRGPQWVCGKCHAIHGDWAAVCDNCGGFDTLAWTEPAEAAGESIAAAGMLPLIVGQPAAPSPMAVVAADTAVVPTPREVPAAAAKDDAAAGTPATDPAPVPAAEIVDDAEDDAVTDAAAQDHPIATPADLARRGAF